MGSKTQKRAWRKPFSVLAHWYNVAHQWCLVNSGAIGPPIRVSLCVLAASMIGLGLGGPNLTTLEGHITEGARWGIINTIVAGVAAPYFGQSAQVAFRRSYGCFFGCCVALPMILIHSLTLRGLLCIPVGFCMMFVVSLLTNFEASKNSIIAFSSAIAGTRAISFIAGAYGLMITWLFILPRTATGQVLMNMRRSLGYLARFHATLYEPLELDLCSDVDIRRPNGPRHAPLDAAHVPAKVARGGHDVVDVESPTQLGGLVKKGVGALLGMCGVKPKAKRPMPVENQPAPDLDASPHDLRESYLWRCRYAFLNVINELAQAKDAQAMAHFEWYAFKVPLFGHKVLLPAHVFEFQFWSSLEPILPDLKVQYLGGCIASVARILVSLRENMADAVFRMHANNLHHKAWKTAGNHVLYKEWLQACQDLIGYYAAVCPTSDLRIHHAISRAPLRRMQDAADRLRTHGHLLVQRLAPHHRPLVRVEALKIALLDAVPELGLADEETRHVVHLMWLELEVDTISRHFSRLQRALEDVLEHVPGDRLEIVHQEDDVGVKQVNGKAEAPAAA